jgi:hypothetical protein
MMKHHSTQKPKLAWKLGLGTTNTSICMVAMRFKDLPGSGTSYNLIAIGGCELLHHVKETRMKALSEHTSLYSQEVALRFSALERVSTSQQTTPIFRVLKTAFLGSQRLARRTGTSSTSMECAMEIQR